MDYQKMLKKAREEAERKSKMKSRRSTHAEGLMAPLDMPEPPKPQYGSMAQAFLAVAEARRKVKPPKMEESLRPNARPEEETTSLRPVSKEEGYMKGLKSTKELEGFRETPYWDVNAYRVGYGSDTITKADGSVVKVTKGMKVSREDAERDFERRMNEEFIPKAKSVAGEAWSMYTPTQQDMLADIAYNYGSLPKRIHAAVKSGDKQAVADAIMKLSSDNDGINAHRRKNNALAFELDV